jgi:hypothetical protein
MKRSRSIAFHKSLCKVKCSFFLFTLILFLTGSNPLISQTKNTRSNKLLQNKKKSGSGMLIPKISSKARKKIKNPSLEMVIFNTSARKIQYFDGKKWKDLKKEEHYIGELFGGGIVFYTDSSRLHGLVAAAIDLPSELPWGESDKITGANGKAVGSGQTNTEKIIKINSIKENAALACSNYVYQNFTGWFLPSKNELDLVYKNLKSKNWGNFNDGFYWTSSETDFDNAWTIEFKTGTLTENNIILKHSVRAVRSF